LTYSIIAFDEKEKLLGIVVASGSIAVGSRVPWAKYAVGGVVTQAYTNPALGPLILKLLEKGYNIKEALKSALEIDKNVELRQVAVMDYAGNIEVHNGSDIPLWNGYRIVQGKAVCVANLVKGPEVCEDSIKAFRKSSAEFPLKLLDALKGGHEAGGDRRGDKSSALLIVGQTEFIPYYDHIIDLRVDFSTNPIIELIKTFEKMVERR